jgi:hypothetical protein
MHRRNVTSSRKSAKCNQGLIVYRAASLSGVYLANYDVIRQIAQHATHSVESYQSRTTHEDRTDCQLGAWESRGDRENRPLCWVYNKATSMRCENYVSERHRTRATPGLTSALVDHQRNRKPNRSGDSAASSARFQPRCRSANKPEVELASSPTPVSASTAIDCVPCRHSRARGERATTLDHQQAPAIHY